ncbi:MAG: Holliday junction branch migration protein RuvA [Gammaproteobacteria bacterium]
MIGFLRGVLMHKEPPLVVVDVQGVGYEIDAPMSTFFGLPAVGEEVRLYTHLHVREDAHTLFGFNSLKDRALFRTLLKVNGVGAKMALTILSGMNSEEFAACVHGDDVASLTRLPGVGKKTAERLIIEMRDRIDNVVGESSPAGVPIKPGIETEAQDAISEAVNALIALGYKPQDASKLVRKLDTEGMAVEEIIRQVLKGLAR